MEHSNGISTYGNRRQSVQAGTVLTKKRILVRVNGRRVTLELEWVLLDFLKVVRMVFWSGVVGPDTSFSLARSLALRAQKLDL